MDNADFANDLVQERLDQALAARKPAVVGHSWLFCEWCYQAIPSDRRLAQPGCTKCLFCQMTSELGGARHA